MTQELLSFSLSSKWIGTLWDALKRIRIKRKHELDEITDQITFSDPLEIAKYYIEPDCQEVNPADRHDEDFFTSREPILKKIDEFFRMRKFRHGDNQLIILSDAGVGKTSLLVMLKFLHLTSFWPSNYDCVLKKISKETVSEISNIESKRTTILLLDSLDEDQTAYGAIKERLLAILDATSEFFKVIITCRTQFFPDVECDPFELPGRIRIGGFVCPSKYISLFDDDKIGRYLQKRFDRHFFLKNNKLDISSKIIKQMGSLRCRPMLLSYIDDLIDSPVIDIEGSEYIIYKSLVEAWLIREEAKTGVSAASLLDACERLALIMYNERITALPEDLLDSHISTFSDLKNIKNIDLKGRSLLNKNSEGAFRFAHYTFQEFLLCRYALRLYNDRITSIDGVPIDNNIYSGIEPSTDFLGQLFKSIVGLSIKDDTGIPAFIRKDILSK